MMTTQYITIKEASNILGVSPLTLRNWDKNGKLRALRHPMNNYRVYRKEDIEKVVERIENRSEPKKREFKKVIVRHIVDEQ